MQHNYDYSLKAISYFIITQYDLIYVFFASEKEFLADDN